MGILHIADKFPLAEMMATKINIANMVEDNPSYRDLIAWITPKGFSRPAPALYKNGQPLTGHDIP